MIPLLVHTAQTKPYRTVHTLQANYFLNIITHVVDSSTGTMDMEIFEDEIRATNC